MSIHTPDWVKNAIFYQIFPDRFARGSRSANPPGVQFKPWGSSPLEQGFQGGDLYGMLEHLDYLQELGINALYLNPIFSSAANHRYHTYDYFSVDPLLGGNAALRALLDEMHHRGMYLVLDGVFNHTGRGFWQFHHVLENGPDSPYVDWFHIQGYPLNPYAPSRTHPRNYAAWFNLPALPKLNTGNPAVQDFIYRITEHWLEFGIDGWRLDVPEEIDAPGFWEEFRRRVKGVNPEAYIVGEIWSHAPTWLRGDRFDALMNYPFAAAALSFYGAETLRREYKKNELPLSPLDAQTFQVCIEAQLAGNDWEVTQAQLNLLDSHDTARASWMLGGDESALRLCLLFQMSMPGAPCIYYGDEIGLSAADDPHCRGAFPWQQPETWNEELLRFYRRASQLRHAHPALRGGTYRTILAQDGLFGFERVLAEEEILVLMNTRRSSAELEIRCPRGKAGGWIALRGATNCPVHDGMLRINVPARDAAILGRAS